MDVYGTLAKMGWRTDTAARRKQAVTDFQRGWYLGPALSADGDPGPKTQAALQVSSDRRAAGKADFSPHFNAAELACGCGGRYAGCERIRATRSLMRGLEAYREIVGPFSPERGYRCYQYNKDVGGVSNSQHRYGRAADLPLYDVRVEVVKDLEYFTGIGYYSTGPGHAVPRHLDVRTGRSAKDPAVWHYGTTSRALLTPKPPSAERPPATPTPPQEDDMPSIEEIAAAAAKAVWGTQLPREDGTGRTLSAGELQSRGGIYSYRAQRDVKLVAAEVDGLSSEVASDVAEALQANPDADAAAIAAIVDKAVRDRLGKLAIVDNNAEDPSTVHGYTSGVSVTDQEGK